MKKNKGIVSTMGQMTLMGLRYLSGRKLRTTLTSLSIVIGVALIFSINLVLPSMQDIFRGSVTTFTGSDLTITSASGDSFAPDALLAQVRGMADVRAVSGVLRRQYALPSFGGDDALGDAAQLTMVGVDPATIQDVHPFVVSAGRFLQPDDVGAVVVAAGLVELSPEIGVGTTFPLITAGGLRFYTVVGLLAEQGNPSAPEIYVTLADAQDAFAQQGLINTVEVSLVTGADRAAASAALQSALGSGYLLNTPSDPTGTWASLQTGLAAFDFLGALALFLGAFLIFNTFRTVVLERRRDIGMLRAVGATRGQITWMLVIESLIQGVIGTALGLLLGYLFAIGVSAAVGGIAARFLGQTAALGIRLNAPAFVIAIGLGLLTTLLAGYLPARDAGKTSPLDALRPAPGANVNRVARWSLIAGVAVMAFGTLLLLVSTRTAIGGALVFLAGMVIAAPALVMPAARLFAPLLTLWFAREGDLARGNLVRQPGRAAITGSTLMIGVAIIVVMAALVSSLNVFFGDLTSRTFPSDVILLPQSVAIYNNVVGADETLANRLRALPDVSVVGTMRFATATTGTGASLQLMGIDPAVYPQVANFLFAQGDEATAFAALGSGRSIMLTSVALRTLGRAVGDEVVLRSPTGDHSYTIVAAADDVLTVKIATGFISQVNLAADFGKVEDVLLMINLQPGADRAAALASIQAAAADYPQFTARLTGEYRDEMNQVMVSALGAFYGIAVLILIPAALGMLNTLTINVLERTREIGVLRAVGSSREQVRRMVSAEALLLGVFGSAMGVLVGVALSYGFISVFSAIGWEMPYEFPLMGMLAALVVGVLIALFAAILPARNAARLDLIRALQYE